MVLKMHSECSASAELWRVTVWRVGCVTSWRRQSTVWRVGHVMSWLAALQNVFT